ncbi:hypothetical protein HPB51_011637 [Rhipicephalus microplus]|uniref:Uncharacterized protein n=1 Tax=Rhipicephalus microplus TaxID=6941 RepID=A0A9J6ETS6_RHIMP|nr:hypothetical protein HPB51_011637 [Rhipicephalus microplus]
MMFALVRFVEEKTDKRYVIPVADIKYFEPQNDLDFDNMMPYDAVHHKPMQKKSTTTRKERKRGKLYEYMLNFCDAGVVADCYEYLPCKSDRDLERDDVHLLDPEDWEVWPRGDVQDKDLEPGAALVRNSDLPHSAGLVVGV